MRLPIWKRTLLSVSNDLNRKTYLNLNFKNQKYHDMRILKSPKPVLTMNRIALENKKLVYIACANKKLNNSTGRKSRIVYIGTTKNGLGRIGSSAGAIADKLLFSEDKIHGLNQIEFYVVYSKKGRQKTQYWKELERALILLHREYFGAIPIGCKHGKNLKWTNEGNYFNLELLRRTIRELGDGK